MDSRLEKKFDRIELAKHFEAFARQIREGTFTSDNISWTVPDEIATKIRYREKKGRFEARVRLRWSTLEDYDNATKKEVDHWKGSLKAVKKQMGAAYREMLQAVRNNTLPTPADLDALIDSSQTFSRLADPDLEEAMKEYLDHLENLKQAVADRQLKLVQHEVRDLGHRMKNCHREFR